MPTQIQIVGADLDARIVRVMKYYGDTNKESILTHLNDRADRTDLQSLYYRLVEKFGGDVDNIPVAESSVIGQTLTASELLLKLLETEPANNVLADRVQFFIDNLVARAMVGVTLVGSPARSSNNDNQLVVLRWENHAAIEDIKFQVFLDRDASWTDTFDLTYIEAHEKLVSAGFDFNRFH